MDVKSYEIYGTSRHDMNMRAAHASQVAELGAPSFSCALEQFAVPFPAALAGFGSFSMFGSARGYADT